MADILSIIIPAYNEGANIANVVGKVLAVELPYGYAKEIFIVDDGSTDDTVALLNGASLVGAKGIVAMSADRVTLLHHPVNMGKGMAIRTALPQVSGKYVVIQDADDELDPVDLATMLREVVEQRLPVLYGSRFSDGVRRGGLLFYYGNRFLSAMVNILYRQRITDEATCYKMFRADLLKSLPLACRGFEFCPEVTARISRVGIKIKECPISYFPRTRRQGKKVRLRDGFKAAWCLIKYRFSS